MGFRMWVLRRVSSMPGERGYAFVCIDSCILILGSEVTADAKLETKLV